MGEQSHLGLPLHDSNLIISDIRSPRMDGLEFLRLIKVHQQLASISVIFSGNRPTLKAEAMELGAFACYSKACDFTLFV